MDVPYLFLILVMFMSSARRLPKSKFERSSEISVSTGMPDTTPSQVWTLVGTCAQMSIPARVRGLIVRSLFSASAEAASASNFPDLRGTARLMERGYSADRAAASLSTPTDPISGVSGLRDPNNTGNFQVL